MNLVQVTETSSLLPESLQVLSTLPPPLLILNLYSTFPSFEIDDEEREGLNVPYVLYSIQVVHTLSTTGS